jgi:23S rRNA (cytidine1920-2'-O)/16S rRNA (cytidine1409-2'-O)-methyltransferase
VRGYLRRPIEMNVDNLAQLLVTNGAADDLKAARMLIRRGRVTVNGKNAYDEEMPVNPDAAIKALCKPGEWASRGGLKLEAALLHFGVSPADKVCLDLGCSTGGFTDVLLAYGAAKVHAVDVGYGVLDWVLRNHPRVAVHERTNARFLTAEQVGESVDLITADLNHISLAVALPAPAKLLVEGGAVLALVKPQFEIPKQWCVQPDWQGGVVKGDALRKRILDYSVERLEREGLSCQGLFECPVAGHKGNREYFALLKPALAHAGKPPVI